MDKQQQIGQNNMQDKEKREEEESEEDLLDMNDDYDEDYTPKSRKNIKKQSQINRKNIYKEKQQKIKIKQKSKTILKQQKKKQNSNSSIIKELGIQFELEINQKERGHIQVQDELFKILQQIQQNGTKNIVKNIVFMFKTYYKNIQDTVYFNDLLNVYDVDKQDFNAYILLSQGINKNGQEHGVISRKQFKEFFFRDYDSNPSEYVNQDKLLKKKITNQIMEDYNSVQKNDSLKQGQKKLSVQVLKKLKKSNSIISNVEQTNTPTTNTNLSNQTQLQSLNNINLCKIEKSLSETIQKNESPLLSPQNLKKSTNGKNKRLSLQLFNLSEDKFQQPQMKKEENGNANVNQVKNKFNKENYIYSIQELPFDKNQNETNKSQSENQISNESFSIDISLYQKNQDRYLFANIQKVCRILAYKFLKKEIFCYLQRMEKSKLSYYKKIIYQIFIRLFIKAISFKEYNMTFQFTKEQQIQLAILAWKEINEKKKN